MTDSISQFGPNIPIWLDLVGIAVFAASGALAAAKLKQTFVTFAFFALATGVGGGTVRDLLIDAPVFWVEDWRMAAGCLFTASLVWVTPRIFWHERALDWFDAVGISVYSVIGSWKALSLGVPPFTAAIMGVFTACVGGVIRDLLAGTPSILLKPEIYVTATALSAGSFTCAVALDLPIIASAIASAIFGFGLRAMAVWKGWAIPAYKG